MQHVAMATDLLYLAERAQSECHLYGIDIQEQAVSASRELLASKKLQSNVTITFFTQFSRHCTSSRNQRKYH